MPNGTRKLLVCLALLLSMPHGAVAAPMTGQSETMPSAQSAGPTANAVAEGTSPTTGLPWEGEYRPLAVILDNTAAARPILGIAQADVVYESIFWLPAHTRYLAIFNDQYPEVVGGIRSARLHHLELREEWDAPFVYWGSWSYRDLEDFVTQRGIPPQFFFSGIGTEGSRTTGFFRTVDRISPHNAMARLQKMATEYWPDGEDGQPHQPQTRPFLYSDTPVDAEASDSAVHIALVYDKETTPEPLYSPSYAFDAGRRVYLRSYCGKPQLDGVTEEQVEAANVIVQYCEVFGEEAEWPTVRVVGGGVMDAFIDGRHIRGTWERQTVDDRTVFYTMDREEITLLPGTTFIQLVPWDFEYEYAGEDGTVITVTGQEASDTLI